MPSRWRFLAAWCSDLLIASPVVGIAMVVLGIKGSSAVAVLGLWVLLQVAVSLSNLGSFGCYALGMVQGTCAPTRIPCFR